MDRRKSVLIVGEDPELIDFDAPGGPPDMSAAKVMDGLNGSVVRLRAAGHAADLLLTKDAGTVEKHVEQALSGKSYDVVVIGAGLRTLPPMAEQFERLMNALRERAPTAKFAFNSHPDDSDIAALRWLWQPPVRLPPGGETEGACPSWRLLKAELVGLQP